MHNIISAAITQGASDIHISPNAVPSIRVAGRLRTLLQCAPPSAESIQAWLSRHVDVPPSDTPMTQRDFAMTTEQGMRVRVAAYPSARGMTLALRILPASAPSPDALLMPKFLTELSPFRHGLVLVTGATGSGKSTTLASWMAQTLTQHPAHIITIEDPIEYEFAYDKSHQGVMHQCELGAHFADFGGTLTGILRRDPDVVMLGELRDLATIELALRTAETGHLVLATLHSANAADAIARMIDVFPVAGKDFVRHVLSNVLLGVVAQKLLPSTAIQANNGRVATYEVLVNTPAVRNLINEHKEIQLPATMQTGAAQNMFTFAQHQQWLQSKGFTTQQH